MVKQSINVVNYHEDRKFLGLQNGGHVCFTQEKRIIMCETGLEPSWCPKPKRYTFVDKCKHCHLYPAIVGECVDYDRFVEERNKEQNMLMLQDMLRLQDVEI